MLVRPSLCRGCPLDSISTGFMSPSLAERPYGVALVGEALGEDEAEQGRPFVGRAGFMLTRMIEWAGLDRSRFDIWNTAWCRPPFNRLEGESYEFGSIAHCRTAHWGKLLDRANVVVPMGNVATGHLLGRKGILSLRGYVAGKEGRHILPTVHPSFIQRGQSKYCAAFIHDLQKAVELADRGLPAETYEYVLDPTPRVAWEWARGVVESHLHGQAGDARSGYASEHVSHLQHGDETRLREAPLRIAFDIETPYKGSDEGDLDDDDDPTQTILRVGFSAGPRQALSIPWSGEYIPAIKLLLDNEVEKIAWNAGFDSSRIRNNGVRIGGIIHDGMVAWHILHSDLPKGLGFVATFTCPWQPEWKSQSSARPAYYNATDADVEWRSMFAIEDELRKTGLWEVYERDVLRIDPILVYMSDQGMPIDQEIRHDRAVKLAERTKDTQARLERDTPLETRRYAPKDGFVRDPDDIENRKDLIKISRTVRVQVCPRCGAGWKASHAKALKKPTAKRPQNPCAGAAPIEVEKDITRYARVEPFKPSREQIIRYQVYYKRPIPTVRDKKTGLMKPTTNEKALKQLIKKYPKDPFYPAILEVRELSKIAGTYIGYPEGS